MTLLFPSLVMIVEIQDFSLCIGGPNITPNVWISSEVPVFVVSVVLFILALVQTLKESIGMYKATKWWRPNQYMKLLMKHGILYFFLYVFLPLFMEASHLPRTPSSRLHVFSDPHTIGSYNYSLN